MAKGKWYVTENRIDGERKYRAVRKIRPDEVEHSGNREYYGDWCTDRGAVEALVTLLNEKEAEA